MDRRSFVKACVGTAGAATVAASGLSLAMGTVEPRPAPGPVVTYFGAHKVAGPAPRGVPYVPVTVKDGVFVGKTTLRGESVLPWYAYCGHAAAPGLREDFTRDNVLTCHVAEEKLRTLSPWYRDLLGKPLRPEDFPDAGFGAPFAWRSQGQSGAALLTGLLVRVDGVRAPAGVKRPGKALSEEDFAFVKREVFHGDFVAVSTFCTHFCCVPGWREDAAARAAGAWDRAYCACHGSAYEPREPALYSFAPEAVSGVPKR